MDRLGTDLQPKFIRFYGQLIRRTEKNGFPTHPSALETLASESSMKNAFLVSQPGPLEEKLKDARVRFNHAKFPGNYYPSEVFKKHIFFSEES
jgi:hypothetical protein